MAKVVFLTQILLIFYSRCNGYFGDTQLKIHRLPNFNNALSACAKNVFQKRTVFAFTESWSCDQLMQKVYLRSIIMQSHMMSKTCKNRLYLQHTCTCIYWDEKTTCCGEVVIEETWPLVRTDLTVLWNPDNSDAKGTYGVHMYHSIGIIRVSVLSGL